MKNQHGLSRDPPESVKLAIRQQAGFGCVVCGLAIAQYEHIDPPFADALVHDPACMTYLCGSCHDRVTRGYWSKAKVISARSNPWAIARGHCHDAFDMGTQQAVVWACGVACRGVERIVEVDGTTLLAVHPPASPGLPYSLSARFYDDDGTVSLEIVDNEWRGGSGNWDLKCSGARLFLRPKRGELSLQLLAVPNTGVVIERLDFTFNGTHIFGTSRDGITLTPRDQGGYGLGPQLVAEGVGEGVALLRCTGGTKAMGGGIGVLSVRPTKDPLPWRRPADHGDPCTCGSAIAYRSCCGK